MHTASFCARKTTFWGAALRAPRLPGKPRPHPKARYVRGRGRGRGRPPEPPRPSHTCFLSSSSPPFDAQPFKKMFGCRSPAFRNLYLLVLAAFFPLPPLILAGEGFVANGVGFSMGGTESHYHTHTHTSTMSRRTIHTCPSFCQPIFTLLPPPSYPTKTYFASMGCFCKTSEQF
jgi:hypothetical protein